MRKEPKEGLGVLLKKVTSKLSGTRKKDTASLKERRKEPREETEEKTGQRSGQDAEEENKGPSHAVHCSPGVGNMAMA